MLAIKNNKNKTTYIYNEKKLTNVYLGHKRLSADELKFLNDTEFWNKLENIKIIKDLEKELSK